VSGTVKLFERIAAYEARIAELERELAEERELRNGLDAGGRAAAQRVVDLERERDAAKAVLHRINEGGHFLGSLVQQDIDALLREKGK
jgi:chromosome segregation ATPase